MKITGINYYPTGTEMAKKAQSALCEKAKEMGYRFYEANGNERGSGRKIRKADVLIVEVNMDVLKEDTFNGKKIIYASEKECIDHPEKVLAFAKAAEGTEEQGSHLFGSFKKRSLAWQ